ncbi:hypothetical protein HYH02_011706 [Chlamydomonas schloesseri]|uniref:ERD4-related membrane protein n=1 Tax=Chlamydomonas schloesseri TaxID=2026947 RepID=A0A835T4N8_9CHLO|nr:hypothetical protein HYH02_011706 [Chlamydomonas schloesseri]|eukprot:KAG2435993.1 hypothetical protein HYH02_011706 [Chlamydomonas schloesseri]
MTYKEADLIDEAGLDAAIYMRILWFGVCLFLGVGVWCIAVVLPANLTSNEEEQTRNTQIANHYNLNATTFRVNTSKDYQDLQYDLIDAYSFFNATEWANITLLNETVTLAGNATIFMNGTVNGTSTIRASILQNATLTINGNFSNNTVTDLVIVSGDLYAYSESTSVNNHDYKFTNFDKYSLSNVEAGSSKMWAHLVSMYMVVIYAMWLISRFNREAVLLRLMFLGNAKRGGPSHTVLVTDVPGIVTGVTELMSKAANMAAHKVSGAMHKKKKSGSAGISPVTSGEAATPEAASLHPAGSSAQPGGPAALAASSSAGREVQLQELRVASGAAAAAAAPEGADGAPASPGTATTEEVAAAAAEMGATLAAAEAVAATGELDAAQEQVLSEMEEIQRGLEQVEREKQQRERERLEQEQREEEPAEQQQQQQQQAKQDSSDDEDKGGAPKAAAPGAPSPKARTGPGPVAESVEPEAAGISSGSDSAAEPESIALTVMPNDAERHKSVFVGAEQQAAVAAAGDSPEDEPAPPAQQLRRRRFQRLGHKYDYNLSDQRLEPLHQAKAKLESGMSPEEFVRNEFELVYGVDDICVVNMVQNTRALQPLVDEYNAVQQKLEDYIDMLQMRLKLRKKAEPLQAGVVRVLGMSYGEWGKSYLGTKWFKKVNAVTFWLDRLRFLKEQILLEQMKAVNKAAPSAFVTFNSRKAQAVSSTSLHHHDVTTWRVQGAPAPFEVVWGNLSMNIHEKSTRVICLWIVFWLMTLFFMIPVSFIQAMIEVPKIASVNGLSKVVNAPVIKQLLEAIIPGLVLKIFLAIVPIILKFMAILSGTTSLSEVDYGVVKRFFLFQVVVVFFGNIIAGSFFNQVTQWIKDPGSVITVLGNSIPQTATFFICYLFTTGMFVKTLAFVRVPQFAIYWLLFALVGSPRARDRLWMYCYVDFGRTVAEHTMAMLLGIVFSCMNPIVCLAAWTYFLATWLGEKYNNIYVYRRQYESAGRLWGTVFTQVMVGLYIMELTMLGLLAIKKFKWTPLAIPLVIITIGFHISTSKMYNKPWSVNALHDAAELDKREREEDAEHHESKKKRSAEEAEEVTKLYKNPCFKVPLTDLERIEALTADVLPRVEVLNKWRAELKAQGKKPLPAGKKPKPHMAAGAEEGKAGSDGGSSSEEDPALVPPPEITKYDTLHVEKDESDGEEKDD